MNTQTLYWVTPYGDTLHLNGTDFVVSVHAKSFALLGWQHWCTPISDDMRWCVRYIPACTNEAFVMGLCPTCQTQKFKDAQERG